METGSKTNGDVEGDALTLHVPKKTKKKTGSDQAVNSLPTVAQLYSENLAQQTAGCAAAPLIAAGVLATVLDKRGWQSPGWAEGGCVVVGWFEECVVASFEACRLA
eukprot:3346669-Rhodomonas_salina.1